MLSCDASICFFCPLPGPLTHTVTLSPSVRPPRQEQHFECFLAANPRNLSSAGRGELEGGRTGIGIPQHTTAWGPVSAFKLTLCFEDEALVTLNYYEHMKH